MRLFATLVVFLGSFLLFFIEPLVAKAMLPSFGGAPAVWNACLFFFQVALLVGYWWAHRIGGRFPRWHVAAMAVALVIVAPRVVAFSRGEPHIRPYDGLPPVLGVMVNLALLIGPIFVLLSAGASVVTRWFSRTEDPRRADPYFLYAASNVGSMLGLFAIPFLVEPRFDLFRSVGAWSVGVSGLVALLAILALRIPPTSDEEKAAPLERAEGWKIAFLAAVPSGLLMAATSFITANVAPIPLLWVVPLALYLLTFTLAFSSRPLLNSAQLGRFLPLMAVPLAVVLAMESMSPREVIGAIHLLVLFVACWMIHARLSERRPPAAQATSYYLWISIGGALGGGFVAFLAPILFPVQFEYPLFLVLALALRRPLKTAPLNRDLLVTGGIIVVAIGAVLVAIRMPVGPTRTAVALLPALALAFWAMDYPKRFAGGLFGVFLAFALFTPAANGKLIALRRSFFGVHRVIERQTPTGLLRELSHGATVHGIQNFAHPKLPLTYYHPTGPAGQVFSKPPKPNMRVALVGLGVGSLSAYGRPGDEYSLYEIDPEVIWLARDSGLFTFIRGSKARQKVIEGDARLTLEKAPDASYDLIALDVFTGDSVPSHLLTREAMRLLSRKLAPDGVLLVHVSNLYIDVASVVAGMAKSAGWRYMTCDDGPTSEEEALGKKQSRWMALARSEAILRARTTRDWSTEAEAGLKERVWTDARSDLLSALKSE